jgi:septum formation protein
MKNEQPTIVLASSSSYRRALLTKIVSHFATSNPNIDESAKDLEKPAELALRLAIEKAEALADQFPKALIIGSDQVAQLGDKALGKPGTRERAIEQLQLCSGQTVSFFTGLALHSSASGVTDTFLDCVEVKFRELSAIEISNYIERESPLDCAGSFKCEGLGITLFEKIRSNDPNSLVGLPLIELNRMLINAGVNPLLIEAIV